MIKSKNANNTVTAKMYDTLVRPVITEKSGRVELVDLINNVSVKEVVDETTGVVSKTVIDWRSNSSSAGLKPSIILKDEKGKPVTYDNGKEIRYYMSVDAILSVVPYYNKPSQEGIYQHYKAIAEATELPIVLYNVPGRTGVNMKAETTLRIARDFKNVIAIKEASGDITQMDDIIKNKPANFDVISGDDGITFPLITLGAVGIISVIGNAFPREFSRMVRLALRGDYANALTIHHKFAELFKLLFVDGNPAGVKAMLNVMGMIENKLRLPLVPTRITTFEAMRKILDELNIKC